MRPMPTDACFRTLLSANLGHWIRVTTIPRTYQAALKCILSKSWSKLTSHDSLSSQEPITAKNLFMST
ncbi:hypothetical protein HZ326_29898 [Fusarium oxysporum f. sp. albedinis]|nr:hypothetical protein HZ326_29898 [Fusarium oxysporum f. sp. albedinis]